MIEKDNKLSELLKERFFKNNHVSIFNEDILSFKLEKKIKNNSIIIGNLPIRDILETPYLPNIT